MQEHGRSTSNPRGGKPRRKRLASTLVDSPKSSGRRVRGAIFDYLGEMVVTGDVAVGGTLPGEVDTAERLDISRGTYREAIKMLAGKGLVESRPKTGTRVLERARWNLLDPDVLRWAFAGRPDPALVADLFEMRGVVEPAIAALAAERGEDVHLERMRNALDVMARCGLRTQAGRDADRAFHEAMLEACANQVMQSLGASIGAAVAYTTLFKKRAGGLSRDPVPDHIRVMEAIEARDPKAAEQAMANLLQLARQDTDEVLQALSAGPDT